MRLLVSGASGYIGKRVVRHLKLRGHHVVCAARHPVPDSFESVPFDLNNWREFAMPDGIDLILHLATNTTFGTDDDGRSELLASRALIDAATTRGIRIIFASSQTAREDAPTEYGRTKWRIENEILAAEGIVVRLGQVYGGAEEGLFGSMVSICRKLPALPAFLPAPSVQPIHVDDCAQAFLTLAESEHLPSRIYSLGASTPIRFTEFLRAISVDWLRQRRLFIPIPVAAIRLALRIMGPELGEKAGLTRLNSLFGLKPMKTASDLADLGIELRKISSGMHRSGAMRRRALAQEARALLWYVLKEPPDSGLVRRYIRLIEALRNGTPLCLPAWLTRHPVALAAIDVPRQSASPLNTELSWRLHAAVVLAEASVQGARRFLRYGIGPSPVSSIFSMSWAIAAELFWRFLALLLRPFLKALQVSAVPR